jgi:Na+/melibiose symporter-like transporter
MATFLSVHGYDPGATQRPLASGAIAGVLATAPAVAVLIWFGSLDVEARILGLPTWATLVLGWATMGAAGAVYARLFGRAANNPHGGWLFGMAFGFTLWAAGAVLVLPIVSGGKAPAGLAALGVALSMLVWGLAIGILLPFVHRPLHENLKKASRAAEYGPSAAAGKERPVREQRKEHRG